MAYAAFINEWSDELSLPVQEIQAALENRQVNVIIAGNIQHIDQIEYFKSWDAVVQQVRAGMKQITRPVNVKPIQFDMSMIKLMQDGYITQTQQFTEKLIRESRSNVEAMTKEQEQKIKLWMEVVLMNDPQEYDDLGEINRTKLGEDAYVVWDVEAGEDVYWELAHEVAQQWETDHPAPAEDDINYWQFVTR